MERHEYADGGSGSCAFWYTPPVTRGMLRCKHPERHAIHMGFADYCEMCGGSGVLNVEHAEIPTFVKTGLTWTQAATWCHGCENGLLWKELL